MRVLFSSTAGMGHFRALTPFADALLACRHEVLVAGPRNLAGMAKSHGYGFLEFDTPPSHEEEDLRSRLPRASFLGEIYGRLRPGASLPVLSEICRSWEPHAVVRDHAEFGSVIAAEQLRIPVVRVSRLASFEGFVIRQCAAGLDSLRRPLGLPMDPEAERVRRSPSLTFWPASLEDPIGDPIHRTVRFRDPLWDQPAHKLDHDLDDGAALIYVTFGTVAGTLDIAPRLYASVIQALKGLPVRALLTEGHPDGRDLPAGTLSSNVRVQSWVNETDVVPQCAAVICHGGSGSILSALAAGVPLVMIPLLGDQRDNARLVCSFGAGIAADVDAGSIRRAVLRILDEDSYRSRAVLLADEMRGHASCGTVAEALAKVIAERPAVSPS